MKNNSEELYVHIPFCKRKCAYCDFTSFVCDEDTHRLYFDALKKQIDIKKESMDRYPVDSVFLGGGTPSLPNPKYIYDLLYKLRDSFSFAETAEITMEMNPGTVDKEKLHIYKESGINRLSIGLQSADNNELKLLSRIHSFEEFERTYEMARNEGFSNINIDIMSALPGQSIESYGKTLEKVLGFDPEHISAYSLIIEENTPFFDRYRDGEGLPSEDDEREMYYLTEELLLKQGYKRYEISNYARAGFECRHNIGYWRRVPYVGFGISAAGFFDGKRYTCHNDLKRFISGDFSEEETVLSTKDCMEEFMFLGLRMMEGIDSDLFMQCFGVSMESVYGDIIKKQIEEKLLYKTVKGYALTKRGIDVSNVCMAEYLLD